MKAIPFAAIFQSCTRPSNKFDCWARIVHQCILINIKSERICVFWFSLDGGIYYEVVFSDWKIIVILSDGHNADTMPQCHNVTMLQCHNGATMRPQCWHNATMPCWTESVNPGMVKLQKEMYWQSLHCWFFQALFCIFGKFLMWFWKVFNLSLADVTETKYN